MRIHTGPYECKAHMKKIIFVTGLVLLAAGCQKLAGQDKLVNNYYKELKAKCGGDSCCLSSVENMEQGGFKLAYGNICPQGMAANKSKCKTSNAWCEPEKQSNLSQGNKIEWETYTNADYGFMVLYPKSEFQVYTDYNKVKPLSYVPACDKTMSGCLFYSKENQKGTNFDASGISVNILKKLTSRAKCETMEGAEGVKVEINGETFSRFGNSGAAAGHFEEFQSNRIYKNNTCYEVMLRMASSNISNYPPEAGVKEFNKDDVWNKLGLVLSTFKFFNSTVSESDSNGLKTYKNYVYGFEFKIPEAWQPVENTKEQLIKHLRQYNPTPNPKLESLQPLLSIGLGDKVNLSIESVTDFATIIENKDKYKELTELQKNYANFKEDRGLSNWSSGEPEHESFDLNILKLKIDSVPALDIRTSGVGGSDREVLFIKGDYIYKFYVAENYFGYNPQSDKREALSPIKVNPNFEKVLTTYKFAK